MLKMGMKRTGKKCIGMVLAGIMCVNTWIPVYAEDESMETSVQESFAETVTAEGGTEENVWALDEAVQDNDLESSENIDLPLDNETQQPVDGEQQDSDMDSAANMDHDDETTVGTDKYETADSDTGSEDENMEAEDQNEEILNQDDSSEEGAQSAEIANSFEIEGTVLKKYTGTGGTVIIPGTVTEIAAYAFENQSRITNISIPGNVKKIGSYAFSGCSGITSVTISSGVEEIGESAFRKCTTLRSINIPGSVINIGADAFNGCEILGRITINEGVQRIGASAFRETQAASVSIPDSVIELGNGAFAYCKNLQNVVLGNGLTELQNNSFEGCSSLDSVTLNNVKSIGERAFKNCISLPGIQIPNTVEIIGNQAFWGDRNLSSLQLGTNVGMIGNECFDGCNSLSNIQWNSKVYSLGDEAFSGTAISSLKIPNSVTEIGKRVFKNCTSLESVVIGTGVPEISLSMFGDCVSLKTVSINGLVTSISNSAFSGCINLTDIAIPDSVTTLGYEAFRNCTSLSEIRLGNGITEIKGYAFRGCSSLKAIYMPFYFSEWGSNILYECPQVTAYIYGGANKAIQWAKESGVNYQLIGAFKPNAVTGLKAVPAGKKKVGLTWNESTGSEGYLIYAQKNGKYGYVGMTQSGTLTSFTDIRALDTEYNYYWVFPYFKDANEKMIVGGTPKYVWAIGGRTDAVTNLKASSVNNGVKLTWNGSIGADGYLIYGIVDGKKYGYVGMTTKGTTYTDKKASKSVWNYYWVFPYHIGDNGSMLVGGTPKYVYGKAK